VLAILSDNEKHKNGKIVSRTAWAKTVRRYLKKKTEKKVLAVWLK
jgi:hypothetical protein